MKYFIGIDPGEASGAVVILDKRGGIYEAMTMPDGEGLEKIARWAKHNGSTVIIEDVQPNRGWHIKSAWSFAKHVGVLHHIFPKALLIPPVTWQLLLTKHYPFKCPKERAQAAAKELWPSMIWSMSKRAKKPHNGAIDAALIAEYARRLDLLRETN